MILAPVRASRRLDREERSVCRTSILVLELARRMASGLVALEVSARIL
jgi:hypothetical protein